MIPKVLVLFALSLSWVTVPGWSKHPEATLVNHSGEPWVLRPDPKGTAKPRIHFYRSDPQGTALGWTVDLSEGAMGDLDLLVGSWLYITYLDPVREPVSLGFELVRREDPEGLQKAQVSFRIKPGSAPSARMAVSWTARFAEGAEPGPFRFRNPGSVRLYLESAALGSQGLFGGCAIM